MRHDVHVLFTSVALDASPHGHLGYLAGRYRDGAWSDEWTDVSRCADGTFRVYAPACTCGWRGVQYPPTAFGRVASRRAWQTEHIAALVSSPPVHRSGPVVG